MSAASCCKQQGRREFRGDVLRIWNERHGCDLHSWLALPWVPLLALLSAWKECSPSLRDPICARCYVDIRERAMKREVSA